MMIEFTVQGTQQSQQRNRMTKNGQSYTPGKTAQAQDAIRLAFQREIEALTGKPDFTPLVGPVRLYISAWFLPPSASPKWFIAAIENSLLHGTDGVPYGRPKRPDADNMAKLVMDALNGIAWVDDAQITDLSVQKRYGDMTQTTVWIDSLNVPVKPSTGAGR